MRLLPSRHLHIRRYNQYQKQLLCDTNHLLILMVMAVTLMVEPGFMMNMGWQLSFASYAGIMMLGPVFVRWFYGERKPGFVGSMILTTMAATVEPSASVTAARPTPPLIAPAIAPVPAPTQPEPESEPEL